MINKRSLENLGKPKRIKADQITLSTRIPVKLRQKIDVLIRAGEYADGSEAARDALRQLTEKKAKESKFIREAFLEIEGALAVEK